MPGSRLPASFFPPYLALVLLGTSVAAEGSTALAGESGPPVPLAWTAPEGCPHSIDVEARVARILGGRGAWPAARAQVAVVAERDGSFLATLSLTRDGETSTRTVSDPRCDTLADAVALVIALSSEPNTPLPSAAPEPPFDAAVAQTAPRSRLTFALGASAEAFAAPSPIGGAWAALGRRLADRVPLEVSAGWSAPQQYGVAGHAGQGATFTRLTATARACVELRVVAALRIAPCAGAGADVVFAQGYGADASKDAAAAVPVALLALRARVPLASWLSVRAEVDGTVPFARPSFTIEGGGVAQQYGPVWGEASVGTELSF